MKNKILYQLLFLLLPVFSFAQTEDPVKYDITGVWKGEFYVDSTKMTYPFELTISEEKGKFTGYSRIAFEENGIKQVVFRDHKIKFNDNTVVIEDDNQLSKASSISQPKEVKKTMVLTLTVMDSTMKLDGTWSTTKTRRFLAASGTAQVQKKTDFRSTEIFKKLEELSLTNKLSFTQAPKEEVVLKLDKVIIPTLAKMDLPKKQIKSIVAVAKPNSSIRPKAIPLAKIEAEPPPVKEKPVEPVVAVVKKPTPPPAVKPTVPAKPKEPVVVAKVDKPAPVKEKPAEPVAVKRQNILPVQANAATDVAKRSISNQQSLFFKSDSLQLTLYDNGEIDGDTVSVLLNGKVIIAKKGLDTKPNSYTIYFDRDTPDSQMLVMYAENLGSIPPNTGLLVVREGQSVYEVRFSADLKTNAAVILRRRKEE